MGLSKRTIVFVAKEDRGYYTTQYTSTTLEGKDMPDSIVGIYKSPEIVAAKLASNPTLMAMDIEWED